MNNNTEMEEAVAGRMEVRSDKRRKWKTEEERKKQKDLEITMLRKIFEEEGGKRSICN